ncbi:MAG: hypothetical protein KA436_03350 [Oligoflexales bacterium]|nr:hypothetical protein [Oligoflexales bacterium]
MPLHSARKISSTLALFASASLFAGGGDDQKLPPIDPDHSSKKSEPNLDDHMDDLLQSVCLADEVHPPLRRLRGGLTLPTLLAGSHVTGPAGMPASLVAAWVGGIDPHGLTSPSGGPLPLEETVAMEAAPAAAAEEPAPGAAPFVLPPVAATAVEELEASHLLPPPTLMASSPSFSSPVAPTPAPRKKRSKKAADRAPTPFELARLEPRERRRGRPCLRPTGLTVSESTGNVWRDSLRR